MDTKTIIWVDLQTSPDAADLSVDIGQFCRVCKIREANRLAEVVQTLHPCAIVFEYDQPRPELLEPLERSSRDFPSVSVVMITEQHSENLAVWALRARAWDYLVKPLDRFDLISRVQALLRHHRDTASSRPPQGSALLSESNNDGRHPSRSCSEAQDDWESRLTPALAFVKSNFAEKVTLSDVADLCGLDRYQFSRAFKQAHGKTFREFLIIYRIQKAVQMLCFSGASITDVAFSVGFNDLSHFAEMFRRYVGVRPSDYVHGTKNKAPVRIAPAFATAGGSMQNSRIPYAKES